MNKRQKRVLSAERILRRFLVAFDCGKDAFDAIAMELNQRSVKC